VYYNTKFPGYNTLNLNIIPPLLFFGIFDTHVVHPTHKFLEGLFDGVDVLQGDICIVVLTRSKLMINDFIDHFIEVGLCFFWQTAG